MKIFTEGEIRDMERKFRILQQDLKDLNAEKAALAERVRAAENRAERAEEERRMAVVYAGIAFAAVADMASEC